VTDAARRSDPTRVLARRTFAWIVDVLLFEAAFLAAIVAFGQRFTGTAIALEPAGFRFEGGDATLWFPKDVPSLGDSVLVVPGDKFWLAVGIFWFVLLLDWVIVQGLTGRTLGKSIVGIRCVTRDRHRPGIGRALLRTILWLIDIIMIVLPIGFILATFTKGHRRVGDFGGGTFVVKKEFAARLAGGREEDTGPERIPASEVQLAGTGEDEAADYEAYAPEDGTPQSVFEPPPEPEPQPEPTPAPAAAAASDAPGATAPRERSLEPVWNDALDTYVRWEPSVERWIGWDEAAQKWRLVDPSRLG
jgi:uncharacterized RDD family membrane protein YckC